MSDQIPSQTPKELFQKTYDEQLNFVKQRARTADVEAEAARSKAIHEVHERYCASWMRFPAPEFYPTLIIDFERDVDIIYSEFQKATQSAFQVFQDATSRLSSIQESFELLVDSLEQAESLTDVVTRLQAVFSKPLAADKIKFVFEKRDLIALPSLLRGRYYD